jgi:hypothetical protein
MRALFLGITLLAAAGSVGSDAADPPDVAAHIAITAPAEGEWTVAYTLPAPAAELVFARSPDNSRGEDWTAPAGFKIVLEGGSERARRTDGQPFSEVRFGVPPRYRDLPKDYAPFMPFGDGGRLFYTGRLFACGGECPDDARWAISIETAQEFVLVNGERHDARASWRDSGQGRNVYVGHAEPVASGASSKRTCRASSRISRRSWARSATRRCFSPPTTCRRRTDDGVGRAARCPARCLCIFMARSGRRASTTRPCRTTSPGFSRTRRGTCTSTRHGPTAT